MAVTTYIAAAATPFAAAAGTGVFFAIEGSATRTVRVQKVIVSEPNLTLVEFLNIIAKKNSTALSGGTGTALTAVPTDSGFAAATANVVKTFTAAPTAGTPVGLVGSDRVIGLATTVSASSNDNPHSVFDFTRIGGLVLRGVAEGLSLHFSAAPASAVTLTISVEWTEE